ncbi:MAG TPA: sulfotransferase [Acetobacteraceae bacterium]
MNRWQRAVEVLRFEYRLMCAVWRSSGCTSAKTALLIGFGYLATPWDLIPDRIPVFGHLDELGFVVAGLTAGRLLVPPALERQVARQFGYNGLHNSAGFTRRVLAWRSALLASWFTCRRRLRRSRLRVANAGRRSGTRMRAALAAPSVADALFALLGYRIWWRLCAPFTRRRSDGRSMIIIGGAARSGTTLLRSILGRHPMIASGAETTVFLRRVSAPADIGQRLGWNAAEIARWQRSSRSQAEFIERVQRAVLERSGKACWAEKTPANVQRFGYIRRRFPRARLVHIIRDGRDAVCSLRRTPFAKLDHAPCHSAAAARRCAVQWRASVKAGLRFRRDPAYHELRYEALVTDPERTLRRLLHFLDLPWDDSLLRPVPIGAISDEIAASGEVFGSSVARWRRDLSGADRRALQPLIGPLLIELGYAHSLRWGAGAHPTGMAAAATGNEASAIRAMD